LYLALPEPELEKSRQSFVQVVSLYPSHQKVPDALYKLGVVYNRLGEQPQAREYLSRVQSEHADSPAARLAKAYAAELR
jgi:TolA-binding protein